MDSFFSSHFSSHTTTTQILYIISFKVKRAWLKWKDVDNYFKKRSARRMKRALSVSQIQSKAWRIELIRQLLFKKILMNYFFIKLRSSFVKWCQITLYHQKQMRGHMLYQSSVFVSKEQRQGRTRTRTSSSSSSSSSSSLNGQQRGRLKSDESFTSNQRRMTIRERAPRKMLTTIDSVETAERSTAHVYKNTGMTADELVQHCMGLRQQKSMPGLSSSTVMPSNAYFFKRAKQNDKRFRPEKISMKLGGGGKNWYR